MRELQPGLWDWQARREEIAAGLRPLLELPVEHVLATHGAPALLPSRDAPSRSSAS